MCASSASRPAPKRRAPVSAPTSRASARPRRSPSAPKGAASAPSAPLPASIPTVRVAVRPADERESIVLAALAGLLFPGSVVRLKEDDFLIGAWAGESPIGFAHMRPLKRCVYLAGIGVAPAYRRQGLGRALLIEAERLAHARYPGRPIKLKAREANPAALRLYQSMGFGAVASDGQAHLLSKDVPN